MKQSTFSKKFTKAAFLRFLNGLRDEDLKDIRLNCHNCFIGVFLRKLYPTVEIAVWWHGYDIDYCEFEYPKWLRNPLYLMKGVMRHKKSKRYVLDRFIKDLNKPLEFV